MSAPPARSTWERRAADCRSLSLASSWPECGSLRLAAEDTRVLPGCEGHARTQSKRARMTSGPGSRAAACTLAALTLALTALTFAAPAGAAPLEPRGDKVWFGI